MKASAPVALVNRFDVGFPRRGPGSSGPTLGLSRLTLGLLMAAAVALAIPFNDGRTLAAGPRAPEAFAAARTSGDTSPGDADDTGDVGDADETIGSSTGPAPDGAEAGDPSTPGALRVTQANGTFIDMPLQHTSVSIEVSAFLERATIEQTFANPFDHPIEAVYTFPLGDRAAVDDFQLIVGNRIVRGEIKRREEAREVYEAARSGGYQAALLEQERPNIFTQSVANLEPGKTITVRIRTIETLVYDKGIYRLTFPLVVGPRYIPGGAARAGSRATEPVMPTMRVPDADRITPPVLAPGFRSGHDVSIRMSLDAGVPLDALSSPSHEIVVDRPSVSKARVRLSDLDSIPNKDFLLRWSVSSEKPSLGMIAHRRDDDGFFTLLVQPRGVVSAEAAAPKEIILVVDTSGSMSGIPLEASKRFIHKALRAMGPNDTFNVVRFAGANEVYSRSARPNLTAEVDRGLAWVDTMSGAGGTEMMSALETALTQPPDGKRMRVVIFLTDGYVGNEDEILARVAQASAASTRVYTVGIGTSVNHSLLSRMAELGNGAYVFIRPDERADEAIESFRSWVTRPYLTDLSIDWGTLDVADVAPEKLRDLGSGQTLALVGRYLNPGKSEIVVRGKLAGRYWEHRLDVDLPERETRHAALASLWARGRIEGLLLQSPGAVPDSMRAEVTSLALAYRLMSPFTSFVAVDDAHVVNPGGQAPVVAQALPLPEGVSFEGVFGTAGPPALQVAAKDTPPEDRFDSPRVRMRTQEGSLAAGQAEAGTFRETVSAGGTSGGKTMNASIVSSATGTAAGSASPSPAPHTPSPAKSRASTGSRHAGTSGGVSGVPYGSAAPPASKGANGDGADAVEGGSEAVVMGGVVGGVPGGVLGSVAGEMAGNAAPARESQVALSPPPPPAPPVNPASGAFLSKSDKAGTTTFSDSFVRDLPVLGRANANVLGLAPGIIEAGPSANANVHSSRSRDFHSAIDATAESFSGLAQRGDTGFTLHGSPFARRAEGLLDTVNVTNADRLLDMAMRVLADLADDGKLTMAEGQPALAGLLAAQRPSGAITEDVTVHAIATWALAEAAARRPHDPWVRSAEDKAAAYLDTLATPDGWPAWPGDVADAEATRWVRFALRVARPGTAVQAPNPVGPPSAEYTQLRNAIGDGRTGVKPAAVKGRKTPFERLVAVIGRGNLEVSRR